MSYNKPEQHRKDNNHDEILGKLKKTPGQFTEDTHNVSGWGDVFTSRDAPLAWWFVIELKNKPTDKLTPREEKTKKRFGDHWLRAHSYEEIMQAFGLLTK